MTAAPIVPVFCRIGDDGTYHLVFHEPYTIPRGDTEPEQVAAWVQRFLRLVEAQVERYPSNSNEYFFWHETPAAEYTARPG